MSSFYGGISINSEGQGGGGGSFSSFDLSDRMSKGIDNNGNVVAGAVIQGSISGNYVNKASGINSHAEGYNVIASGNYSHAEGRTNESFNKLIDGTNYTKSGAYGIAAHSEGFNNLAMGNNSHAQGSGTMASGTDSHAEGYYTVASGSGSHVEGSSSTASGGNSHAEGIYTTAIGSYSHTEGRYTTASYRSQHVFGEFNINDSIINTQPTERGTYIEIVGNGTGNASRSNARTLDWQGNERIAGDLTFGPSAFSLMALQQTVTWEDF